MQCTPTSAIGPPPAMERSLIQVRPWLVAKNEHSARAKSGFPISQSTGTLFEAKDLCHAEEYSSLSRRLHHLSALLGIHPHRLLAEHRLAQANCCEDICEVASVRGSDQYCVHFRTAA